MLNKLRNIEVNSLNPVEIENYYRMVQELLARLEVERGNFYFSGLPVRFVEGTNKKTGELQLQISRKGFLYVIDKSCKAEVKAGEEWVYCIVKTIFTNPKQTFEIISVKPLMLNSDYKLLNNLNRILKGKIKHMNELAESGEIALAFKAKKSFGNKERQRAIKIAKRAAWEKKSLCSHGFSCLSFLFK